MVRTTWRGGLALTRDRLYPPEIMPLPFRAKGVSLSTATVRVSNSER
jgi:hypothetical protein